MILFPLPYRLQKIILLPMSEWQQEFFCDRVHSLRLTRPAWFPYSPLFPLSRFLPDHNSGEPGLDHPDSTELSPEHPHVLIPLQPLHNRFILLLYHHPQKTDELYFQKEHHILGVCFSSFFPASLSFLTLLCCQQ